MTQRHIYNIIRLVLDLIDYADLCKDDSFILFINVYKPSIEHEFIFKALANFNFGNHFCAVIKTMYKKKKGQLNCMPCRSRRTKG